MKINNLHQKVYILKYAFSVLTCEISVNVPQPVVPIQ